MEIFNELVQKVSDGKTFYINFETKTLKVGKTYLVKNGEYDKERLGWVKVDQCTVMETIERLYNEYKFALPSERSDSKRRTYFKSLPIEEIPDSKLFNAERREVARARLEGYILCSVLYGNLTWDESWGSWFYQSSNDPDLVILRSWIENKNN
jgi:hypothetical protein